MPETPTDHARGQAGAPVCVVLLSGGLDSAVTGAIARGEPRNLVCLSFDYGQRHRAELDAAREVARSLGGARHVVVPLDLRPVGGSALTADVEVPKDADPSELAAREGAIPATYVPARNMVFLSVAAGLAEVAGAREVWIGVNALDYSGYPDCREAFIRSFERTANLATRAGVEGGARGEPALRVRTPLLEMSKADIVRAGAARGVDFALTLSCYDPPTAGERAHCGRCDACLLRKKGFSEAGVEDPTVYGD